MRKQTDAFKKGGKATRKERQERKCDWQMGGKEEREGKRGRERRGGEKGGRNERRGGEKATRKSRRGRRREGEGKRARGQLASLRGSQQRACVRVAKPQRTSAPRGSEAERSGQLLHPVGQRRRGGIAQQTAPLRRHRRCRGDWRPATGESAMCPLYANHAKSPPPLPGPCWLAAGLPPAQSPRGPRLVRARGTWIFIGIIRAALPSRVSPNGAAPWMHSHALSSVPAARQQQLLPRTKCT